MVIKTSSSYLFLFFVVTVIVSGQKPGTVIELITAKDSLEFESLVIEAEKRLIIEEYEEAEELFRSALEVNGESAALNFKLSRSLINREKQKDAVPYAVKSVELAPDNKYYALSLARLYKSTGATTESAQVYEGVIAEFPEDQNALYELAELYQITGEKQKMFAIFDLIEQRFGVQEEIVRERQRLLMREGKIDQVAAEYHKLIEGYPNEANYRIELISFLIQHKKIEEAEKEIAIYESQEAFSSRVTLFKSEVAWVKGERVQALALLETAFKTPTIKFQTKFEILSNYLTSQMMPSEKIAIVSIAKGLAQQYKEEFKANAFVGDLLFQTGQPKEALDYYLKATEIDAGNFSVWQNVLNIEASLGNTEWLIIHAEKALEYFPNQALLYYYAGTGYLIQQDFRRSTRMLETGRKYTSDPKLLTTFFGQLGDAYHGAKEVEKSYKSYEKALENDPENDHVLNNYSYFLSIENRKLEKALKMSTKLIEMHPDNPTYLDTHGWVLFVSGEFKKAKKYLEKAANLEVDGTIVEHFGDVLYKLGQVDKALEQWKKAQDLGGTSDQIDRKIMDEKYYE
ncbi:MAG: tetratricopeptide repeat protein [Bacteroidota bacterium]